MQEVSELEGLVEKDLLEEPLLSSPAVVGPKVALAIGSKVVELGNEEFKLSSTVAVEVGPVDMSLLEDGKGWGVLIDVFCVEDTDPEEIVEDGDGVTVEMFVVKVELCTI